MNCSGLTAVWCAVHGDCLCERFDDGDIPAMDDPTCPLHSVESRHAIGKRKVTVRRVKGR